VDLLLKEEDVKMVKLIVKETVAEILETEFYDAFFALLDGFEAGIQNFRQQIGCKKGIVTVKEDTFECLNFEPSKGSKIGEFEVAVKEKNPEAAWLHAYNILKQSKASINNRYHGEGYKHSYWLYGEGKIYRQKLKPRT